MNKPILSKDLYKVHHENEKVSCKLIKLYSEAKSFFKRKGKIKMSINWHYRLAIISIVLGLIHGILGISAYF